MRNVTELRLAARGIFDETLTAVDARGAMRHAVRLAGSQLSVCNATIDIGNRKIYSVAIGKAASTMAHALEQILGDSFTAGGGSGPSLTGFNQTETKPPPRGRTRPGGKQLPNQTTLTVVFEAFDLFERANEETDL